MPPRKPIAAPARPTRSPSGTGQGRVRIIGGLWKRRLIEVVDAPGLRPTPDRVRETLFNWLGHAFGGDLRGRSALDLFAGSGALGFEAASRGAEPVMLVDRSSRAIASLTATRASLQADRVEIRCGDGVSIARELAAAGRRFDMVFLDPPFGHGLLADALPYCHALLTDDGRIYAESDSPLEAPSLDALGYTSSRADRAGDVFYHLLQRNKKNEEETSC